MKDKTKSENEEIFLELVKKYLKSCEYAIERKNDLLQIVFRGKTEEMEITVYCDPDEYTVGIGEYYHTHFDIYSSDKESETDKFKDAGEEAIGFIQAFMRNEIWLKVTFRGDEAVGSEICDENDSYSSIIPVETKNKNMKEVKKIFKWEK